MDILSYDHYALLNCTMSAISNAVVVHCIDTVVLYEFCCIEYICGIVLQIHLYCMNMIALHCISVLLSLCKYKS